ncbi:hypothetical protein [Chryseobacterium phocaeense]|uniref:hypothetical protein n=1 Tax=Chryseobacterium phocaeense TaxID=1816690 RepID=UPI00111A3732|nr:hypothetical protein [Chryseobacterium phocaeense]
MKLESLKSEKFEAMTADKMSVIKGGYNVATGGGPAYYQGREISTTSDINVYNNDTNHWTTQILYLKDGSKIVISM